MNNKSTYFEIFDAGDMIRVEVVGFTKSPSIDHINSAWLEAIITTKACTFRGQYTAEFMPVDFYNFRQQLIKIIYNLDNTATFEGTQGYLQINFKVEPDDYIGIKVKACDLPGIGGDLTFGVSINKSDIYNLVEQLDQILELYHKQ